MLWINQKANDCRWLGMGLVVGHRCAALITRSHDIESNVRRCWNGPRCSIDCYRCRPMQNHEGIFSRFYFNIFLINCLTSRNYGFAWKRSIAKFINENHYESSINFAKCIDCFGANINKSFSFLQIEKKNDQIECNLMAYFNIIDKKKKRENDLKKKNIFQ